MQKNTVEFSFPVLIRKDSKLGQLYSKTCHVMLQISQNRETSEMLKELRNEWLV